MSGATDRANRRWANSAVVAEYPEPCSFCRDAFRTARGARQHERRCWKNPDARQFKSGEYLPLTKGGRIVGCVRNDPDSIESLRGATEAIGFDYELVRVSAAPTPPKEETKP